MVTYYYHGWTQEEDLTLIEIMSSRYSRRKKTGELFEEAAAKLERTVQSCMNRWYKLRKDMAV